MLTFAAAPAAFAGTKIMGTPPAARYYPNDQQLDCTLLNVNKTPRPVTIEVIDYDGNVEATNGPLTLDPSTAATASDNTGLGAWCRFTVDGSTKKYRAAAVYSVSGVYTASVLAK
jgi:hypothetical protein